jgi:hypothetical protein
MHPNLQAPTLASILMQHCTLNGEAVASDITAAIAAPAPEACISVAEGVDLPGDSSTTTTDGSETSTNTDDVVTVTPIPICKAVLQCTGLPMNTGMATWRNFGDKKDMSNLGPLLYGGYSCPNNQITYCDVEHKRMVAAPDASGCVAGPGHFYANATGGAVDKTGIATAGKCNPMGSAQSGYAQTACQCLTGYEGASCEVCAQGYLVTPVLLGDGVHSLTAVSEVMQNSYMDESNHDPTVWAHSADHQAQEFDYNNDFGACDNNQRTGEE